MMFMEEGLSSWVAGVLSVNPQVALPASTCKEPGGRQMLVAHPSEVMRTRGEAERLRADSSTEKDHNMLIGSASLGWETEAPPWEFQEYTQIYRSALS